MLACSTTWGFLAIETPRLFSTRRVVRKVEISGYVGELTTAVNNASYKFACILIVLFSLNVFIATQKD